MQKLKGLVVDMVTPLQKDGEEVDIQAIRAYCDFILQKRVQGLFVLGIPGEGPLLSLEEKKLVSKTVVDQVKGKIRVIIQTGCVTTAESVVLTEYARHIGAEAAGIMVPSCCFLDDEALVQYVATVAKAVPGFPIFLYNNPQVPGSGVTAALFQKLMEDVDNLVGIMTGSSGVFDLYEYIRLAQGKYSVLVGCAGLVQVGLTAGADGILSGTATVYPCPFADAYEAIVKGNLQEARRCQEFINKLRLVVRDECYIDIFKKALGFRGIQVGTVRAPNSKLLLEETTRLKKSLEQLGLPVRPVSAS